MTAQPSCATFTLDFTDLQHMAAVALNRWAHKNHLSARLRISKELNISPRTVDNWVQGRSPVPQTQLARLILMLDEGFALELIKELASRGEHQMLARIFRHHIQNILEPADGHPRHSNTLKHHSPDHGGHSPLEMA